MKLIFFDESKNDPDYPHYHLGAVCLDESTLIEIEGAVQAVALDAFGTAELSEGTEFHAAEIFHRKKNFKEWYDFDRRIALLGKLVEILSQESVQLIDIQINCALLHEGTERRGHRVHVPVRTRERLGTRTEVDWYADRRPRE